VVPDQVAEVADLLRKDPELSSAINDEAEQRVSVAGAL